MQIDAQALRRHYASLSDEELLAIDRAELTAVAQKCYDAEFAKRELDDEATDLPAAPPTPIDWTGKAACVCTFRWSRGRESGPEQADNACVVLRTAGIPCRVETTEAVEPPDDPQPRTEYAVMVPSVLYMQASNVLDKEIFNLEREAGWKTHLESLSDVEFRALTPEILCGAMKDLIERVMRLYNDEIQRRKAL